MEDIPVPFIFGAPRGGCSLGAMTDIDVVGYNLEIIFRMFGG